MRPDAIIEAGHVYGRLTVRSRAGLTADRRATWACECACGEIRVFPGRALRRGEVTSCGCAGRNAWWPGTAVRGASAGVAQ